MTASLFVSGSAQKPEGGEVKFCKLPPTIDCKFISLVAEMLRQFAQDNEYVCT